MNEDKIKGCLIALIVILVLVSPFGIMMINSYHFARQKADDVTNYKTKKEVEDTCRSFIVSYESDKLMYEQYKDSTDKEELKWANNAKIRANKTAVMYNEYILKNSYVFDGNIPSDLKTELEILE